MFQFISGVKYKRPECPAPEAVEVDTFLEMLWRIFVPEDWRRVLITSSGQVTTAPMVPPTLKRGKQKVLSNKSSRQTTAK